jgi:uncharacterized membrane protein YeaQ/YmgE (transglycosylase-associated protein family)
MVDFSTSLWRWWPAGCIGWLASLVMNRDASMGIFWNIVVGCVGSVVGNLVANQFGYRRFGAGFSIARICWSRSWAP